MGTGIIRFGRGTTNAKPGRPARPPPTRGSTKETPMFCASLLVASLAAQPTDITTVALWDGKAPHAVGDSAADKPTIAVYRLPADKANGTAVVICPGGGYGFLADDHEGKQVAEFFNRLGVTAFVLKYRIVTKDRPGP